LLAEIESGCQFKSLNIPTIESDDGEYCIFHAPVDSKNDTDIVAGLKEYVSQRKSASDFLDLSGIKISGELNLKELLLGGKYEVILLFDMFVGGNIRLENTIINAVFYARNSYCGDQWLCHGVTFCKDAHFDGASMGLSMIVACNFYRGAYFQKTIFRNGITFDETIFHDRAWFQKAQFSGYDYFKNVTFKGETYFDADFGNSNDDGVSFNHVTFKSSKFSSRVSFLNRHFTKSADFSNVEFKFAPEFHNCKMNQSVIFNGVKFLDVRGQASSRIENDHLVNLPAPADSYRVLRKAMELVGNSPEQAKLFSLEQRCLRKDKSTPIPIKIVSWLYLIFSDYGNSLSRPLLVLLLSCLFFLPIYKSQLIASGPASTDWGYALGFSMQQIVRPFSPFMGDFECDTSKQVCVPLYVSFIAAIQSIIAILSLTLFVLAIRRRFRL